MHNDIDKLDAQNRHEVTGSFDDFDKYAFLAERNKKEFKADCRTAIILVVAPPATAILLWIQTLIGLNIHKSVVVTLELIVMGATGLSVIWGTVNAFHLLAYKEIKPTVKRLWALLSLLPLIVCLGIFVFIITKAFI